MSAGKPSSEWTPAWVTEDEDPVGSTSAHPGGHTPGSDDDLRRAIVRRETTSSRAPAAVAAALLVGAVCLYFMFEALLKGIGQEPWIRSWEQWWIWFAALPQGTDAPLLGVAGALLFLLGLVFFLQAVLPGRRVRYLLPDARAVVIVDAQVLAASLARRARMEAGVNPDQVLVTVSRRVVRVQLRPTSGIPVNRESVEDAVRDELLRAEVEPRPDVSVTVAESGVIGQ